MTLDHVIDTTFVLVSEAYVAAGMSVFEAIERIEEIGKTPDQKMREQLAVSQAPPLEQEAANTAMLDAMMRRTTFKGPRG